MSTDITLEVESETSVIDFDAFTHDGLDPIARAVAVAMHDPVAADAALTAALRSARDRWNEPAVQADPGRFVFAAAITHEMARRAVSVDTSTTELTPLIGPACTVAYFGLSWTVDQIWHSLQLSPKAIERHLDQARSNGFAHAPQTNDATVPDIRYQVRQLLSEVDPPLPNLKRIERKHRWGARRSRIKIAAIAAALVLAALVLLAQLVQRPDRIERAVVEPEPTASADRSDNANAAAGEIGNEPRPDLVPTPQLITTDGNGGFVGVRSPSAQNAQAVFTRSTNGETWSLASRWSLGSTATINRFERSGDNYMAWLDGVAESSDSIIGTVGISRDLIAWTVVQLALVDRAPNGLIYNTEISDLAVSGNNILALVTTNVEIDFAALSLSEGYTCGQTITDDEVSVKLCNDAELDVLSLSDIEVLPPRTRLFVSRDGNPFGPVDVPFDERTATHLTSVNGSFAVTDNARMQIAISNDATNWQTITAGKPPFPVRAAAINAANEVVGVGDIAGGETVLFHTDGRTPETSITALNELLGTENPDLQAVVASGPDRWAVYVFEPFTNAWLLTSRDGVNWSVLATSPPIGDSPRLLVGDNEALVQWIDTDDETITLGVPLS